MDAFLLAAGIVFVAELGDKTQLLALAFAARHGMGRVVAGVALGTFAINLVSAIIGDALGSALPTRWIHLAAGIAFIGFGFWTLFGSEEDEEDEPSAKSARAGVILGVAAAIFLAELGDKTMLATIAIAGREQQLFPVWIGASLGMLGAITVAVVIGAVAGKHLPEKPLRIGSAVLFFAAGAWMLLTM